MRFAVEINGARRWPAVVRLVSEVVRRFGSPERLAREWVDAIQEARQRRPGSATVVRCHMAIMKLWALAEREPLDSTPPPAIS